MADENPVTTNRSLSNDANPMANFASGDRNVDTVPAFHQDGNNSMSKPNVDDPSQQFNPYNHARLNPNFPATFYPGMYPYPPQGMFPEYDRNFSANMYDRERWLAANRFPGPTAVNGSGHHWPPGGGPTSGGVGEDWMAGNDGRGMNAMPSHPWVGGMPFYPQIPGSNMMNRFDLSGFPPHGINYPKPGDASSADNALNSSALSQMPARFGGPNESQFDAQHHSDRASNDEGVDSGISAQGKLDETTGEYISGDGAQQKQKSGVAKKKKKRKRSESEDAEAGGSEQSAPPKAAKKSKKKKTNKAAEGEGSGAENAGEENASTAEDGGETKPPKPKRIRKRKPKATGADSAEGKKQAADELRKEAIRKKYYERRNIRTIKESETLASETKDAQKEEQERLRRLEERKEMHMQQQNEQATSELKSLLECEDFSEAKEDEDVILLDEKKDAPEVSKTEAEMKPAASKDVVEILSSEDEDDEEKEKKQKSSTSDLGSRTLEDLMKDAGSKKGEGKEEEEVDEGPDDPDNFGSHVNDLLNVPDSQGRVLVNTGHPPDDSDVYLAPQIAAMIKPHQIGGIRFMYDNLVESVKQFKASTGFGCILAHSMGLGKTVQVIGFIDVFMRSTGARTVLVIVPVNTLQNWVHEFNMWLPRPEDVPEEIPREELQPRPFDVHVITDSCRSQMARANIVDKWSKNGGVLIVGYEMFRLLTTKVTNIRPKRSRKKNADPVVIDVEEEEKTKELLKSSYDALIKPGPDLVVCDEGHRIKNCAAGISRALKDIRTKRRVVMTGYPLQNNLQEYWCMVDFVRPNFLGSRMEFSNMFERPIMNGQCVDSTPADIKIMRYRAHVLHSLLLGFVQRRSHSVLQYSLPPKDEYVLLIRLSPIQRTLYNEFIHMIEDQSVAMWASKNPIKAFAVCCKIWNHPDIIYKVLKGDKKVGMAIDNDLDIDDVDAVSTSKVKVGNKKAVVGSEVKDDEEASVAAEEEEEEDGGDAGCFKKPHPHPALPPSLLPDASSVSLSSKFSDSDADSMLDLSMLRDADMDMPDLEEKLLGDALERGADGMLVCDEKATGSPLRDSKSSIVEGSSEVKVKDTTAPAAAVKVENMDVTEAKNVLWTLNGDDSSCDSKSEAGSISNLASAATVSVKSEGLAAMLDNGSSCDFKPNIGAVKEEIKAELSPPKLSSSLLNGDSTVNIEMKKPAPAKIGTATENQSLMHLLSDDPSDEGADAVRTTDTLMKAPPMTAAALRPSASCPVIPVAAAGFNKATIKPGLASSASLDEAGKPTPTASGSEKKMQNVISYDWAADLLKDYKEGLMECGPKVALLRHLLDECVLAGDKMLVFSQSLLTLSLIEEFLNHWTVPGRDYTWAKNKSYFRLDGGTSTAEREKMINQFNDASNDRVLLFLLSTRAGSLGINLIGANRVIVFDASWNPCHDAQAVCRVYRYGQYKHCYIYRFVADGTMEKKIYDRQVNKEGISNRVVDELNPTHFLTKRQVDLLNFEEKEQSKGIEDCDWTEKFGDSVLCKALSANHRWLSAMPFKHEALLTDRLEERLSKAEKRKARESYEMEKRMGMAGSRPSVGGYRTIGTVPGMMLGVGGRMTTFNRPVASIRPMMSNPTAGGNRPVSVRPDVVVQQIHTTTDIIIPNSSGGDGVKKIPRGEKVILIKTPKGVYMRTNEGKIYAVRTAGKTTSTSGDSATTSSASITTSAGSNSSATAVTSVLASATASTSKADGLTSLVTKVGGGANVTLVKKEGGVTRTLPSGAIVLRMPVPSNGPGVRLQGASLVHSTMGKRTVSVYKIASTTATTLNLANCIKASSKMGAMRPAASSSSVTTVTTASVAKKEGELSDAAAASTSASPAGDGGEGTGEDGIASTEDGVDKLAVGKNEAWKNKLMVPIAPVNRVVTAMATSDPTNQAASVTDGMTGLSSLLTSSGGTVRSVSSTAPPTPSVGNWQQALDITTDKSASQLPTASTAEPSTSSSIISLNKQDKVSPVKVIEITTKPLGGAVNKGAAASNSAAKAAVVASTLSPGDSDQPGEKAKKKRYPKKKKDAETVDNDSLSEPPTVSAAAKPARKRSPKKPAGVTLQQPVAMETDVQRSPADGVKAGGQMPAWQQPQQQQQHWQNPQQQPQLTSLASPPAQGQGQQMKTAPQQGPSSGGMGHPQQMLMQQQSRPFGQGEGQPEMDPSRSRLGSWSMQQQGDVHGRPGDWQQQQQRSEMPQPPDMQRQSSAIEKGSARSEFESVFSSLLQPDDYWAGGHNSHSAAGTGAWDPWTTPRPGQQQQQQHSVNRSDGWPKESSNVGSAWHQPTPSHQQQQTQQQSSVIDLDSWQQQHSANSGPGDGGRKLSSTEGSLHGQQQATDPLARGDNSFSGSMSQFRAPEYPVPGAYDQRWAPSYMGGSQMAPAPPAPSSLGMAAWQHPWMAASGMTAPAPSYGASPYGAYPSPYYSNPSTTDYMGFGATGGVPQGAGYMHSNVPGYPYPSSHAYPPYGTPGYPWPGGRNGPD